LVTEVKAGLTIQLMHLCISTGTDQVKLK